MLLWTVPNWYKNKTLDRLYKMHVDIASNIQGMAPNPPALVALAGMK